MKIRKSELKAIVEEVIAEASGVAKQTKGLARGILVPLPLLGPIAREEEMNEAPGLAKADPKKTAKGSITGPPPNQKQITNLSAGTNGWSGLIEKLDRNVAALKKAKAIDASTASQLDKAISKMIKVYRAGAKAQSDKWKKTGKQ